MTATIPETVMDALAELAPPCEVKIPCDRPAEWVIRFLKVCECGPALFLLCVPHKDIMMRHDALPTNDGWRCGQCGSVSRITECRSLR